MTLEFFVAGLPITQGSKRAFTNKYTGRAVLVEDAEKLKPWRWSVGVTAAQAMAKRPFIQGPVRIRLQFLFPRPKSHYGTGRNHNVLKASAPSWPTGKPDLDKLQRAVFDALTHVVWADDSQVTEVFAMKRYNPEPGVLVGIEEVAL
jgi:Holliday junction resolvase RusA-like endonuclease